jgi:hypothetical protein
LAVACHRRGWPLLSYDLSSSCEKLEQLRSYFKPIKTLAPDADHRAHKRLNNAIEGSHRPTRKREKIFGRFKSHRQAQRFLSAHDQINLIFRPRRFQLTANSYRHARTDAFSLWAEYTIEMVAKFSDQQHPTTRCQQLGNADVTAKTLPLERPLLEPSGRPIMLHCNGPLRAHTYKCCNAKKSARRAKSRHSLLARQTYLPTAEADTQSPPISALVASLNGWVVCRRNI